MGRVVIRQLDQCPYVDASSVKGFSSSGSVRTSAVIAQPGRPIYLWKHDLEPGASLALHQPQQDHCFYVLDGSVTANETIADNGSLVVIEHLSRGALDAESSGASLLHFHRPDDYAEKPARAGGQVHIMGVDGIAISYHRDSGSRCTLMAGADCQTCQIWLNKSEMLKPFEQQGRPHRHASDEIIVVTGGEMLIDDRVLTRGAVLAIDANTDYGYGVGRSGLSLVNFRPQGSGVFMVETGLDRKPASKREHPLRNVSGAPL
jgi:redox-sensitive bicupin YhaK (pirin superfamily)